MRMRDLAVQSANGAIGSAERDNIQKEFAQLQDEVNRVVTGTTFNKINILAGGASAVTSFQIGAQTGDTISFANLSASVTASVSAVTAGVISVSGVASAATQAITAIDSALDSINTRRSEYGAAQSRFEGVISQLSTAKLNNDSAASRIMDTDYAAETARMTRSQVLQQAGVAMLAQANQLPNNVMSLLR